MLGQRILVTGATGFVGRHLVARLLSEPVDLTLAVRNGAMCPASWQTHDRIRVIEAGDIETSRQLDDALSGATVVVHLAGLAHRQGRTVGDGAFMTSNAHATERLAKASVRAGVRTFIHLSSLAAITGNASDAVVDDQTDRTPSTPYGQSKRAAERHVLDLPRQGIFSIALRPPLVVGAEAKGNWGALQRLAATRLPLPFRSVKNSRSLIGVRSVADAIAHLCLHPWSVENSGAYCIAGIGTISLFDIVSELRSGMGLPSRVFPFPPSALHALANISGQRLRAAGLLGDLRVDDHRFRTTFDFDDLSDMRTAIREAGMRYLRSTPDAG